MHTITFYPLGNADTCLFELANGKLLLFDYADVRDPKDKEDKRIDLHASLKEKLQALDRSNMDVVAFTHADDDHIHAMSEFFYLEHAKKYQGDERIRIDELWVPASVIIEEGAEDEAKILRAEARYRLKQGEGIRVFSRPERLAKWLETSGIKLEDRRHLITDAGQLVPGISIKSDGLELFVHSPYAKRSEESIEDRNEGALIFHATFVVDGVDTRMFIIGDTIHEILSEVVSITKAKKREERLQWDIFDIPHHCSYLALSSEKGKKITMPVPDVKWLLDQGNDRCLMISSSKIITNEDTTQPPHMQAAECYRTAANSSEGEFIVTMEHPNTSNPEPIVITIGKEGPTLLKRQHGPYIIASGQSAPRAG
ncbi:MAG: hypothetical protein P9X24_07015 [Candidatus Hatepunaea meridiana]|nr:hypothetical protein [Candidatus Hatepunaea meridiana]